jgi:hypothetical protein
MFKKKMSPLQALALAMLLVGSALAFSCAPASDTSDTAASAPASPAAAEVRLPVSLNDVMVALVNHAADPIWVAAWNNPETDKEWRELERMAYQLEIAGALLPYPGTGPMDDEWVAQESWASWSKKLQQAGADAVVAVQARDVEAVSNAGDTIVEVCEGCHLEHKFAMPTGGKFGELAVPPSEAEKEEGE